jgi:hypothetical protein
MKKEGLQANAVKIEILKGVTGRELWSGSGRIREAAVHTRLSILTDEACSRHYCTKHTSVKK